jgi:hypothetical protein
MHLDEQSPQAAAQAARSSRKILTKRVDLNPRFDQANENP